MTILKAEITDSEALTELTKKSKAHWGYPEAQIALWSEQLTITGSYIMANAVYKLLIDDAIAGYYSYYNEGEAVVRLDNLFVLPQYISQGYGRLLMDDFLLRVANTGIRKIILESEPNAETFYTKFGFIKIGQIITSIEGRYLPLMELTLDV